MGNNTHFTKLLSREDRDEVLELFDRATDGLNKLLDEDEGDAIAGALLDFGIALQRLQLKLMECREEREPSEMGALCVEMMRGLLEDAEAREVFDA